MPAQGRSQHPVNQWNVIICLVTDSLYILCYIAKLGQMYYPLLYYPNVLLSFLVIFTIPAYNPYLKDGSLIANLTPNHCHLQEIASNLLCQKSQGKTSPS